MLNSYRRSREGSHGAVDSSGSVCSPQTPDHQSGRCCKGSYITDEVAEAYAERSPGMVYSLNSDGIYK